MNGYIGVTGFMKKTEVQECLNALPIGCERKLMVGILASSTTIEGKQNSLWNKFPLREDFANILVRDSRAFKCVHFATREPEKLYDHLSKCLDYGSGLIDGFQLNIVWPDAKAIETIKQREPRLKFVFQVSPHMAEFAGLSHKEIAKRMLGDYGEFMDYAIIDYSRGLGINLDVEKYADCLRAFQQIRGGSQITYIIGGGRCADNLAEMEPLLMIEPGLGVDAEGKLRHRGEGGGEMNVPEAKRFIKKAAAYLGY